MSKSPDNVRSLDAHRRRIGLPPPAQAPAPLRGASAQEPPANTPSGGQTSTFAPLHQRSRPSARPANWQGAWATTSARNLPILDEQHFTHQWAAALYGGQHFDYQGLVRLPDGTTVERDVCVTGGLRREADGTHTSVVTRKTHAKGNVGGYELSLCVSRKDPAGDQSYILCLTCTAPHYARLVHNAVVALLTLPPLLDAPPPGPVRILAIARSLDSQLV